MTMRNSISNLFEYELKQLALGCYYTELREDEVLLSAGNQFAQVHIIISGFLLQETYNNGDDDDNSSSNNNNISIKNIKTGYTIGSHEICKGLHIFPSTITAQQYCQVLSIPTGVYNSIVGVQHEGE